jgi:hypothetical protein
MQARDAIHITPQEWRWVILFSVILISAAFIPFLWVAITGAGGTDWQFMGVLNNYRDGATYLSKMVQGVQGEWLVRFQHTPEPHNGALIQVIYPTLGHLARLLNMSPIALFHAARVVASFIMYTALYHLGATIWMRVRTRRIFFVVLAIGSGLGWIYLALSQDNNVPDLSIPEIYPFFSSLVNVHFPLALACLALLASIVIVAFRPGCTDEPTVQNSGLAAALLSFFLSLLFPQALVPLGAALGAYVALRWLRERRASRRELQWLLVIALPALPIAAYYAALVAYNPSFAEWSRQNVTPAPNPLLLIIGLGIPLLMALPGIYRGVRRFEADGDQFMLLWLVVMIVVIYLPTNIQRRFAAGLMIPVAYFATRALEDFWFQHFSRRWRYRLLMGVGPLITMSYVLILFLNINIILGPFLKRDYAAAFQWLKDHTASSTVVLAAEEVSIWLPGWTGAKVVYGHPFETLQAAAKKAEVRDWYSGQTTDCNALLEKYRVRYVIFGSEEQLLGQTTCLSKLNPVYAYGSVTIYTP